MSEPKANTCQNCFYYANMSQDKEPAYGNCHRHAPSPLSIDDEGDGTILPGEDEFAGSFVKWPYVIWDDWCGEFKMVDSNERS